MFSLSISELQTIPLFIPQQFNFIDKCLFSYYRINYTIKRTPIPLY